jgi:flavin-binding protein dodecin
MSTMSDRTYKIIELVGISETSFSDAVDDAIARAEDTLNDLSWFEVVEQRGSIADGAVNEYQVKVKVAFELE